MVFKIALSLQEKTRKDIPLKIFGERKGKIRGFKKALAWK